MTTRLTVIAPKTLLISLAAFAIGLAGPAAAKDRSHNGKSAYASSVTVVSGPASKASGTPISEPTYMAIQTKGWKEND
jgi:hypothetical protein